MTPCLLGKPFFNAILVQLPVSLALPEHGVLPPLELLVRVQVASLLHVPAQGPQAFQIAHVPSTERVINIWFLCL